MATNIGSFEEYVQQPALGLVLGVYLGDGYPKHLDSYNRATTYGGSGGYKKGQKRWGFDPKTNGRIVVADSGVAPELRISSGTLICFFHGMVGGDQYFLAKRDAGGSAYHFGFAGGPDRINTYDGTGYSILAYSPKRSNRSASTVIRSGNTSLFYVDGSYIGAGTGTQTPAANDADLTTGALYTGGGPTGGGGIQAALIFNTVLSDTQISDIHNLFMSIPATDFRRNIVARKLISLPPADISATCTEVFPMRLENGVIVGAKGVSQGAVLKTSQQSSPLLVGGQITGSTARASQIAFSNPANLLSANNGAVEVVVTPRALPAATGEVISSDAATNTVIQLLSTGVWRGGRGNPQVNIDSAAGCGHPGVPAHLILSTWLDGATKRFEFFLDGVSLGASTHLDATVVSYLNALGRLAVNSIDGAIDYIRPYSTRVTAADARKLYLQYATVARKATSRTAFAETPAALGAGLVGPYRVGSGTWQWLDDGTKRRLVNVTAGFASLPSKQAYGAWYWRLKEGAASIARIAFVADKPGVVAIGTDLINGYYAYIAGTTGIVAFYRISGLLAVNILTSVGGYISASTEYEFFLTRRYDGLFTLFIRGGAYTTWTTVGSGTDTTHTTSSYVVADIDAADELSDLTFFPAGGTVLPTDVLELL